MQQTFISCPRTIILIELLSSSLLTLEFTDFSVVCRDGIKTNRPTVVIGCMLANAIQIVSSVDQFLQVIIDFGKLLLRFIRQGAVGLAAPADTLNHIAHDTPDSTTKREDFFHYTKEDHPRIERVAEKLAHLCAK